MYEKKNQKTNTHTKKIKIYKCIEYVLTSHSENCTAYLLIDERTGSGIINNNKTKITNSNNV